MITIGTAEITGRPAPGDARFNLRPRAKTGKGGLRPKKERGFPAAPRRRDGRRSGQGIGQTFEGGEANRCGLRPPWLRCNALRYSLRDRSTTAPQRFASPPSGGQREIQGCGCASTLAAAAGAASVKVADATLFLIGFKADRQENGSDTK